jgi:hypothetical protein
VQLCGVRSRRHSPVDDLILTGLATIVLVWLVSNRHFGRIAADVAARYRAIEPNLLFTWQE